MLFQACLVTPFQTCRIESGSLSDQRCHSGAWASETVITGGKRRRRCPFSASEHPPAPGMLWCLCESLKLMFDVIVSSWGLQASSICNWVSFPPTELALALIYLRVQISPCLLLKASTSSQNLFLLLETVPPPLRDTHHTRATRRGDLLLTA